jgi:hypothetical protein
LWRYTAKLVRAYLRVRKDAGPYLFTGREGPLKKRMVQTLFGEWGFLPNAPKRYISAICKYAPIMASSDFV